MRIKAIVTLKNGVLDPQAKAIYHALHAQGFESVEGVKLARQITLTLKTNDKTQALSEAKQMCESLLANMVIEEYCVQECDSQECNS